jgi:hypothetical protein
MATKLSTSPKEQPLAGGTTIVAGQMYVHADSGVVVVAPSNMTAAAFATLIGASAIKAIDYPSRVEQYTDGSHLFD